MAAIWVPKPGSKDFCKDPCEHPWCSDLRQRAAAPCTLCGEEIGYETPYYGDGGKVKHQECLLKALD